jgi:hypothetical protein
VEAVAYRREKGLAPAHSILGRPPTLLPQARHVLKGADEMQADLPRLEAALEGLERRFLEQGAPVGRQLGAGLSDGEIDVFTANLPFQLSDELRCFYHWHDGVQPLRRDDAEWPSFPSGGGGILAPLHLAVEDYQQWMAGPNFFEYQPMWFPINSLDGRSLVVDCGVSPGDASPIHYVDNSVEWQENCAPSLLAVIELWNRMLDDGYWVYDQETGDWKDHYAEIPLELRLTNLV